MTFSEMTVKCARKNIPPNIQFDFIFLLEISNSYWDLQILIEIFKTAFIAT